MVSGDMQRGQWCTAVGSGNIQRYAARDTEGGKGHAGCSVFTSMHVKVHVPVEWCSWTRDAAYQRAESIASHA